MQSTKTTRNWQKLHNSKSKSSLINGSILKKKKTQEIDKIEQFIIKGTPVEISVQEKLPNERKP